jgi:hypothetical protein
MLDRIDMPRADARPFLRILLKILFGQYSSNLNIYTEVAKAVADQKQYGGKAGLSKQAQRFLQTLQRTLLRDEGVSD